MEFVNIATQHIDCEVGATHNELRTFVGNAKHYNTYISKCIGHQPMFKSGACVICSIVNIVLDNHYINEDHHFNSGESKKWKSNKVNKHKVLLKSPCLNQEASDNMMSEQYEKESDGDNLSTKDDDGDGDRLAMLGEYNGDVVVEEDNGEGNLSNKDKVVDLCKENDESEVTLIAEDNVEKQVNGMGGMEVEEKLKKRKIAKRNRNKRKMKLIKDNTICISLPTILKAPCLNTVEHNDIFRRDIVNIVSFWFGYVGLSQLTSTVRQVIPRGRLGMSTIYEWVLCGKDNNSMKVLVIPICALSDSRLLLHQSYGLVFMDKEKALSAYIHKDFDTDIPNCVVPSIGWITDVALPKFKERAELKDLNQAPMLIEI